MRHLLVILSILTITLSEIHCVGYKDKIAIGNLTISENQLKLAFESICNVDSSNNKISAATAWFHNYLDTLYLVALSYREHRPNNPLLKKRLTWVFDYSITRRTGYINSKLKESSSDKLRNSYNIQNVDSWDNKIDQDLSKYLDEKVLNELYEKYFSKMNEFKLLQTAQITDLSVVKYTYLNIPQEITLNKLIEGCLFCPLIKEVTGISALKDNLQMIMRINFKKKFAELNKLLDQEIYDKHENYVIRFLNNEYENENIKKQLLPNKTEINNYYQLNKNQFLVPASFQYVRYQYDPHYPGKNRNTNFPLETFDFNKNSQPYGIPNEVINYFSFRNQDSLIMKIDGQFYMYKLRSASSYRCVCPLIVLENEIKEKLLNEKASRKRANLIDQAKKLYDIKFSSEFKTIDDYFYTKIYKAVCHQ